MENKISKLAQILNESFNEKSLSYSLSNFFEQEFKVKGFRLVTNKNDYNSNAAYRYQLYRHKKQIANIEFAQKTPELSAFLKITGQFISLKIQNIILSQKMQKDINFHDMMKNIAKIIETQYELKYIIPLIGEMLDKFFENYLSYIFLKNYNTRQMELSWPNACNDELIVENVRNLREKFTSEDKKIFALPLVCENKNVGAIVVKSTSDDDITQKDKEYVEQLSTQIAITINRANVYAEILKHATLDALTGFYNRHQLEERIKQEVSNAKRRHAPLCGIMTDVDFFKNVNDTYGHAVGDLVLKTIAKVIRGQLREYDIAGRYGGEEFSILLPFTKINEAQMVAERLRKAVEEKVIDISKVNPNSETKEIKVTISSGIYEIKENDNEQDLMLKTDKALYQAKNTGRNKVVVNYD